MIAITNRIFIYSFTALFLVAAGLFSFYEEPLFLLAPFGLLACLYLIQHPEHLFYLLAIAIPWSIEYNFTPSLGTDLPDEPIMWLTAFTAMLLMAYHGKKMFSMARHPLLILLIIQLTWTMVTVAASTDVVASVKYVLAKGWYLLTFVVAAIFLFRDEKIMRRSFIFLLSSMLLFMFVALVRHAQNGWTFEKINDSLLPFFRNHVNYSALLVFMVPLQIAVLKLTTSKRVKLLVGFTLAVTLGALYFSYARGAWLALIAGFIAYWAIRKKALLFGYITILLISLAAIFWLKSSDRYLQFTNDYNTTIFHTNFREHLIATYQLKDVSTAERFHRWVAGVRMADERWVTGFGPTTFYKNYKSYTLPAFKTWVSKNEEQSTVHNYFLLMMIEQGLPGLLLFAILFGALLWYAQKIYHRTSIRFWKVTMAATAAVLAMQLTVNFLSDLVETDKIGSIFYLCIAVLVVGDVRTRREKELVIGN